jgi:hypothetical protein
MAGSFRAVLIDATVPWHVAPRVDGEVFRFAAWDGGGSTADWLLPAPGFLEELTDAPTAPGSAVETYAIAARLVAPPDGVHSAAGFLAMVDASTGSVESAIGARCEEIVGSGKGLLCGNERVPVDGVESAAKLQQELLNGAVWMGDPAPPGKLRCELKEWPQAGPPPQPGWTDAWMPPVMPPLATKLYRESSLREPPARRAV